MLKREETKQQRIDELLASIARLKKNAMLVEERLRKVSKVLDRV